MSEIADELKGTIRFCLGGDLSHGIIIDGSPTSNINNLMYLAIQGEHVSHPYGYAITIPVDKLDAVISFLQKFKEAAKSEIQGYSEHE
jgi:hypothetical protein